MKISVVIPALDEEKYLPNLLNDLKDQTFKDFEVIVADADSKDKTRSIAKRFGAKVVEGGKPSVGRNNAAKVAKGNFLFFLDADVRIPRTFLANVHKEMYDKFIDLATCEFSALSDNTADKVIFEIFNISIKLARLTYPHAMGFAIFISKRLFERVDGFDESIKIMEDHDLIRRAAKFRNLRILKTPKIKVSMRRFEKEGRLQVLVKSVHMVLHRTFLGEIRDDIIKYDFGNYDEKSLARLRKDLADINRSIPESMDKNNLKNIAEKFFDLLRPKKRSKKKS